MKGKYEEIMDKIEVTDEMRTRVLDHVTQACNGETEDTQGSVVPFFNRRRISAMVAVMAILLVGAFVLRMSRITPDDPYSNPDLVVSGHSEFASLEELEAFAGFSMTELSDLPFEVTEVSYLGYEKETAEIIYSNSQQSITYTKTKILDGNNGHYETYETEKQVEYNGLEVTVKANAEGAYILSWEDGDFAYMIYSDIAMSEEDLLTLIP